MKTNQPATIVRAIPLTATLLALFGAFVSIRAAQTGNWQSYVLGGLGLFLGAINLFSYLQQRRGVVTPGQSWILIGSLWLATNVTVFLVDELGITLVVLNILLSLLLATLVFDRTRSNRAMLGGFITAIPMIVFEYVLDLPFRLDLGTAITRLAPINGIALIILGVLVLGQFGKFSLRQKLVITYLFLALLPMGILSYLNDNAFRRSLTDSANQSLFLVASQTGNAIDSFVNGQLDSLLIEARLEPLRIYLETPLDRVDYESRKIAAEELLRSLHEIHAQNNPDTELKGYLLIDDEKKLALQTMTNSPYEIGRDFSLDNVYLIPALNGTPYASGVRAFGRTGTAYVFLAVRITNEANQPIGVLVTAYDFNFLQTLVLSQNDGAGQGSFGILMDENQIILAHGARADLIFTTTSPLTEQHFQDLVGLQRLPDLPISLLVLNSPELNQKLANAVREPFFSIEGTIGNEGTSDINQVAVAGLANYPWQLAFFQPQEIFLQPSVAQTNSNLIVVGVVLIFSALIALYASAQLSRPILQLTAAAERVAAGDLNVEAVVETQDEIGTLANTFNSMTGQLRQTLGGLESLVAERTARLQATNEVGRVASSILNPEELIGRIVNLITDKFGYYYAAIFLLNETEEWAVLQEATGEAGAALKRRNHRLEVGGQSMVGSAIATGAAKIALDVGAEPVRFDNPLLPETRSEIALPLIAGTRTLGALDVQSRDEAAFGEQDIETLQNMANQVAIAIANANLFERTQEAVATQQIINQITARIQQSVDIEGILETTAKELARYLDAQEIVIHLETEKEIAATNGSGKGS